MKSDKETLKWLPIVVSRVIAFVSYRLPSPGRPIDYNAVLHFSLPLSVVWLIVAVVAIHQGRRTGLWALLGLLPALYWPVSLCMRGIPECYWRGNCV